MNTNYIGDELTLFEHAHNWKRYWAKFVVPYLGQKVVEVGAGIGGTTKYLITSPNIQEWLCIEPDKSLAQNIIVLKEKGVLPKQCEVKNAFLTNSVDDNSVDSILYIDVIEHIEDDAEELRIAYTKLKNGGHLIILVPAHNFLYSPFDKIIGHYRRYNKEMLRAVLPVEFKINQLKYLDSIGLLASFANKSLLKQSYPTLRQLKLWDNYMIPLSKLVDSIIGHRLGKSVLLIAQK